MTNGTNIDRNRGIERLTLEGLGRISHQLPPVIYAFRLPDDVIKIGWSASLDNRRRTLKAKWPDLLAIKPGTLEDEQRLHRRIPSSHRHHAVEYYLPTPQIIAMLNQWRADFGVEPIPLASAA